MQQSLPGWTEWNFSWHILNYSSWAISTACICVEGLDHQFDVPGKQHLISVQLLKFCPVKTLDWHNLSLNGVHCRCKCLHKIFTRFDICQLVQTIINPSDPSFITKHNQLGLHQDWLLTIFFRISTRWQILVTSASISSLHFLRSMLFACLFEASSLLMEPSWEGMVVSDSSRSALLTNICRSRIHFVRSVLSRMFFWVVFARVEFPCSTFSLHASSWPIFLEPWKLGG